MSAPRILHLNVLKFNHNPQVGIDMKLLTSNQEHCSPSSSPRVDAALVDHMPEPGEWSQHYLDLTRLARRLENEAEFYKSALSLVPVVDVKELRKRLYKLVSETEGPMSMIYEDKFRKGHKPADLIHNGVGIADLYATGEFEKEMNGYDLSQNEMD